MKSNRGIVAETVLVYVLIGVIALFVPNPISTAAGIGQRPNKTVYREKVELIKDHGQVIGTKTTVQDDDIQQRPSFFEWLMSLPVFVLVLMSLGVVFPPVSMVLVHLRAVWKQAFKNTYDGLRSLKDTTVICRKCGDTVTIDTKEHVFDGVEKKQDKKDKILQEKVRTELTK